MRTFIQFTPAICLLLGANTLAQVDITTVATADALFKLCGTGRRTSMSQITSPCGQRNNELAAASKLESGVYHGTASEL